MKRNTFYIFGLLAYLIIGGFISMSSEPTVKPNYDETKVPAYTLPDPLVCSDGSQVQDRQTWVKKRRPEILSLFAEQMYGKTPTKKFPLDFDVKVESNALGGKAVRKQVTLFLFGKDRDYKTDLLIYLPKSAAKPVPAFVALNFQGNHTICADPGIPVSERALAELQRRNKGKNYDPNTLRGVDAVSWQVEKVMDRGYALATMFYDEIDPDFDDGFKNGIQPYFYESGQTQPKPDEWGSIGAWAWGLSRILDYFERDQDIDAKRVAVMGHSRLGKTALWAGAQDERFALVISNNSGCGGAALSRRAFGETVGSINRVFPHWFCDNFNKYNENEAALPIDQHELIALIAPRPVYVASAEEDRWADPKGEFLAAKNAEAVYRLWGKEGLGVSEMPPVDHPVGDTIGYHIRTGKHAVLEYDWDQYLKFADRHLQK